MNVISQLSLINNTSLRKSRKFDEYTNSKWLYSYNTAFNSNKDLKCYVFVIEYTCDNSNVNYDFYTFKNDNNIKKKIKTNKTFVNNKIVEVIKFVTNNEFNITMNWYDTNDFKLNIINYHFYEKFLNFKSRKLNGFKIYNNNFFYNNYILLHYSDIKVIQIISDSKIISQKNLSLAINNETYPIIFDVNNNILCIYFSGDISEIYNININGLKLESDNIKVNINNIYTYDYDEFKTLNNRYELLSDINQNKYIDFNIISKINNFQNIYKLNEIKEDLFQYYEYEKIDHFDRMLQNTNKNNPWLNLTTNYNNVTKWKNVKINNYIPEVKIWTTGLYHKYPITILHYGLEIINKLILQKQKHTYIEENIILELTEGVKNIFNYIQTTDLTNTFPYVISYKKNGIIDNNLTKNVGENTIDCMTIGLYLSFISKYNVFFNENNKYLPIIKNYIPLLKINVFGYEMYDSYYDINSKIGYNTILNKSLYFIIGCHDYYMFSNEIYFKNIFKKSIKHIENLLPFFDLGNWSCYDLSHLIYKTDVKKCSSNYHIVHIKLLKYLYIVTNNITIKFYYEKFKEYLDKIY